VKKIKTVNIWQKLPARTRLFRALSPSFSSVLARRAKCARQPRSCWYLYQIFTDLRNIFTHWLSNKPVLIWLLITTAHLKYVATLPCNLSLMACFTDINGSQGSVATYARRGEMFIIRLTANLSRNLAVKKFLISVKNWQKYGHGSVAAFFAHPVDVRAHQVNSMQQLRPPQLQR